MKNVAVNARSWIAGSVAAFLGVALARMVGPSFGAPLRVYITVAGQLLAIGGLFIICLGVRRRIERSDTTAHD